jgi:hypothetical protein
MAEFILDPAEGKTRADLVDDYLRCLNSAFDWQRIAMELIEASPDAVAKLPPKHREKVNRLIEAYKD